MNRPSNKTIIDKYFEYCESKGTRKSALKYFFDENHFNYEGHIFDIDTEILSDYFRYLKDLDLSLSTKQTKWWILKSFLDCTMEIYNKHKFFVVFPKKTINWNGGNHKKPNGDKDVVMTLEEIEKILHYMKLHNYKYYLIFRTFTETGMRKGELINANYSDVDLENRTIDTKGKTGLKTYFISKDLANKLHSYLDERKMMEISTKALFLSKGLYRYGNRAFNMFLKKILKKLGIQKNITTHTFRKTLNTLRFSMGCSDGDLEFLLGHNISVNRDYYVKLNQEQKLNIFDKCYPYLEVNL